MTFIEPTSSFSEVYRRFCEAMETADIVHSKRWQGVTIAGNPNMACRELTHRAFAIDLPTEDLEHYRQDTGAEFPWSDDHFEERVAGYPMNPGTEWQNWSQAKLSRSGVSGFLDSRGKFNHNYMERYWPRFAGQVAAPTESATDWRQRFTDQNRGTGQPPIANRGIMYEYGQLIDVVDQLADDPYTRQAYFPIWFPEDTGGGDKRAPCTIGYHFLMRNERLDINYHIRSCDLYKHFRNDLYLTVRLLLWMLEKVRKRNPEWKDVRPGKLIMQIGSLHLFKPDWDKI